MFREGQGANRFERDTSGIDNLSLDHLRDFSDKYIIGSVEKNKIDEEEFEDVYSSDTIETDKQTVLDRQEIFQKSLMGSDVSPEELEKREKLDILAKEFEAICSDHTLLSRVYALSKGEIVAQSTADYDDIMRKTDLILEFPREKVNPNKRVGEYSVGLDVTISKYSFKNKFEDLYKRFNKEPAINKLKYYRESSYHTGNNRMPRMGEASIPRYIINAKPEELVELIDGWKMWRDNFKPMATLKETQALLNDTGIAKSKIWYRILYQLIIESHAFYSMFKENQKGMANVFMENYKIFAKNFATLKMAYIKSNREWSEKYEDIQRGKDAVANQVRMDHLNRQVHETYNGSDMGYIKKIIQNNPK